MEGKLKSCPLYSQDQSIVTDVRAGKMPSADPTPEQLQTAIDRLLEAAERCYRLARGVTDRQTIDAMVRIAEECEERAEDLRQHSGT